MPHKASSVLLAGLSFVVCTSQSFADANQNEIETSDKLRPTLTIQYQPGFRLDDLSWNVSGSGGSPNILSELIWNRVESRQLGFSAEVYDGKHTRVHGYLAYASVQSGINQDSDYDSDDRNDEFSRSDNRVGGALVDVEMFVSHSHLIKDPGLRGKLSIAPLFGYAHYEQQLTMTDGVQVTANPPRTPNAGPLNGLNSSYDTQWQSLFFGAAMAWQYTPQWRFGFTFQRYVMTKYDAVANWNLRTDFQHPVSFRHDATGDGYGLRADVRYQLNPRLYFFGKLSHNNFKAHTGTDQLFLANGTTSTTNLNAVYWRASSAILGIGTRF